LTSCSSTDRSPLESFTSLILQGTRVLVRSIYQPNHGYVSALVHILFRDCHVNPDPFGICKLLNLFLGRIEILLGLE